MKRLQNQAVYFVTDHLRKLGAGFGGQENKSVAEMHQTIDSLDGHVIQFKIENYPDGSWSAESSNIDGIMTGSRDPRETAELIKDAVFTYFEIPPRFCRDDLLRSDNEPVTTRRQVHVGA